MIGEQAVSHDQLFKIIFIENPVDTIIFAIPESKGLFKNKPEIVSIREESLKDTFAESFSRYDAPFLAKFENKAFIFLVEHQHDKYKFSIYKLNHYVLKLEELYACDVIPIVSFPKASRHDKAKPHEIKSEFLGKIYHQFAYELVCLKDYDSADYLESDNIFSRMMLPFMKFGSDEKLRILKSIIRGLFEFIDDRDILRRMKCFQFIDYNQEKAGYRRRDKNRT
ncbi:hypothetical protein JXJ21_08495 [candidate division KSB1 bacterium]|nr:hypothetical protein [candidate division KSB1 bacterium]